MQLNLKHAQEDIAVKASGAHVKKVLAFELFILRGMFKQVEREQSMELAREALSYSQDFIYKAERLLPLKVGRDSRVR